MKTKQVNFRAHPALKRKVEAVCFVLNETLSEFVRKAISDRIMKKASKNIQVLAVLEAIALAPKQGRPDGEG